MSFSSVFNNDYQWIPCFVAGSVFTTMKGYFVSFPLISSKNFLFYLPEKHRQSFPRDLFHCYWKNANSLLLTPNTLGFITALNKLYVVLCLRAFLPFQIVKAFSPFYFQVLRCPYCKVLVHMRVPDLWSF